MTAPAAFKATFSDFRLVKGRKVAQIVVEVPIEEADNALKALGGIPRPDLERWVAVARLSPGAFIPKSEALASADGEGAPPQKQPTPAPGEARKEYTLANRVGMTCADKRFQDWLYSKGRVTGSAEDAAHWVRHECGVKSRTEILPGTEAAARWTKLETQYLLETGQMAEQRR